jgi:hypothetical protein
VQKLSHDSVIPGDPEIDVVWYAVDEFDAFGNKTHHDFDALGRETKVNDPLVDSQFTPYFEKRQYDAKNLRSVVDRNSFPKEFDYDPADPSRR